MKANTKNKKGSSTMKKLVPAAGMLMISASMLATSTFAWFTMSKEVEITSIQMTATVPETVELSLGYGQNGGVLTGITGTDGIELVKAPANSSTSLDWSNSVAFCDFYTAPKLEPASSINGTSIFTTDDANGVGKTVNASGSASAGTKGTLGLHTSKSAADSTPTSGTADYIDFPVWFRTSSTSDITLAVYANVTDGENSSAVATGADAANKLHRAARVSIINYGTTAFDKSTGVVIPSADGTAQTVAKYYVSGKALGSANTLGTQGTSDAYGTVDPVTQTVYTSGAVSKYGENVVTVAGKGSATSTYQGNCSNTSDNYGNATCVIVRVWLEGEDQDCWNATAGQDFQIALKFDKIVT